jgi:hypothetical protein
MRAGIVCAFILISPLFICCTSFEWHFKDGNAVITKYKGKSPDAVIPGKIQGRPVTEIGEGAFRGCGLTFPFADDDIVYTYTIDYGK